MKNNFGNKVQPHSRQIISMETYKSVYIKTCILGIGAPGKLRVSAGNRHLNKRLVLVRTGSIGREYSGQSSRFSADFATVLPEAWPMVC
jgi:hypothetical protein